MNFGLDAVNPNLALAARGVRLPYVDPLERERRELTVEALRDAQFMREMLAEQRMRELEEQDSLTKALPGLESAGYSPEAVSSALRQFPRGASAIVKRSDATRKARADEEKVRSEAADKQMSTRINAAKLLANQAFQLSNKEDITPGEVQSWARMVADNGLESLLPAPRFQDWSNPVAARKTLATAGASLFEAHQQVAAAQKERELAVDLPKKRAETAKTILETQLLPRQVAVTEGNLAVNRGQLNLERDKLGRPVYNENLGWVTQPTREDPTGRVLKPEGMPAGGGKVHEKIQSARKELNTLQPVQDYRTALPVLRSARNAPDDTAGDIDIIYAVGKILDPNSVVRESELKLALQTGSPADMVRAYLSYVSGGARLTKPVRARLIAMLENRVGQLRQNQDSVIAPIKAQVESQGLPWAQIYPEVYGDDAYERPAAAPGAARTPGIIRITPTGR